MMTHLKLDEMKTSVGKHEKNLLMWSQNHRLNVTAMTNWLLLDVSARFKLRKPEKKKTSQPTGGEEEEPNEGRLVSV